MTFTSFGQGTQQFDAMDILEYNSTLRIFQPTTKKKLDVYVGKLDASTRVMTITRKSDGLSMQFKEVTLFREEGMLYLFSAKLIDDKLNRTYPASGFITPTKLRINLGDYIYVFYTIDLSKTEKL